MINYRVHIKLLIARLEQYRKLLSDFLDKTPSYFTNEKDKRIRTSHKAKVFNELAEVELHLKALKIEYNAPFSLDDYFNVQSELSC